MKFELREMPDLNTRPVVQASLGCHVEGLAQPHPCPKDPVTALAGALKRFACLPPKAHGGVLRRLRAFVRRWLKANLVPLTPDVDLSFETWLEGTNYPEWRKAELRVVYEDLCRRQLTKKDALIKSFVKLETYLTWKHARCINARVDAMKVMLGPVMKAIEHVVYQHPAFIKNIPVADRPRYIFEQLYKEGATYLATDYTSFEALFTEELMKSVEFQLYDYMTKDTPFHDVFMGIVRGVLGGKNKCAFKDFDVFIRATRMSGEMCTSLGNGFSNLMFFLFVSEECGFLDPKACVEGDDCVASGHGRTPTSEDFEKLGLNIKLEVHTDLALASFCGLVFDLEDQVNVTDPLDVLVNFGWTSRRYARSKKSKHMALIRCKALSLAHQYPGCPVISALAEYGLRVTRGFDVRHVITQSRAFNTWEREQLIAALRDEKNIRRRPVPIRTRGLVADRYGLPIELQLSIEAYLDGLHEVVPLQVPAVIDIAPEEWSAYFHGYSTRIDRLDPAMERPYDIWPLITDCRQRLLAEVWPRCLAVIDKSGWR